MPFPLNDFQPFNRIHSSSSVLLGKMEGLLATGYGLAQQMFEP